MSSRSTIYAALREHGGPAERRYRGRACAGFMEWCWLALEHAVKWGWRSDNAALQANTGRVRRPAKQALHRSCSTPSSSVS